MRYLDEYVHKFGVEGAEEVLRTYGKMGTAAGEAARHYEKVQNFLAGIGPGMARLGNSGVAMADQWGQAGAEAERVNSTFDSLAQKQGLSPQAIESLHKFATGMIDVAAVDDEDVLGGMAKLFSFGFKDADKLTELMPAIAAQARDYGMSIDESAKMVGKAISSGNVGALTRSGVLTMDFETRPEVKRAQAMLQSGDAAQYAAGQQAMLNLVVQNSSKYASSNAEYMKTNAAQLAAAREKMNNLREAMGAGVNAAKAWEQQWTVGVLGSLGMTDEKAARAVGGITEIGSQLLKYGGEGLSVYRDVKELGYLGKIAEGAKTAAKAKDTLKAATAADTLAEKAKSAVAGTEALNIGKTAAAARDAATAKGLLNKASLAGVGGVGKLFQEGGAGVLGATGLLGMNPLAALSGGAGLGGAALATGGILAAAGGGLLVGTIIAKKLEAETGYQEKGGNWLADKFTGSGQKDTWAAQAATQDEITAARQRARERGVGPRGVDVSGAYGTTQQLGGGDLRVTVPVQVTVPGNQVLTRQAMRNYNALR